MAQTSPELTVLGGGLAGCEAAWQAAERGVTVVLYEMRPARPTAAHKTDQLAELVCSNSLGSAEITNAAGILKEEMRRLGSLVVRVADTCRVPAGSALAVDRVEFAARITKEISSHPNITLIREELPSIPEQGPVIVATGPLTSDALAESLKKLTKAERLYFFDAISPIVDGETIDRSIAFAASRYNKGGDDYLNCPMTEAEYNDFYAALLAAEKVPTREFEKTPYFEGCMPIEVQAERGRQTLLFGPMKPVGLVDPRSGQRPFAVVQLRPEDVHGQAFNIVGFQTKLKWPEQKRVFRMIPGLEQAEFLRFGSLHRNTFINAPLLLRETLQLRYDSRIFFAGQIVGVEGYTESAGMGLLAGINAANLIHHKALVIPPPTTTLGTLITYLTTSDPRHFQPMNVNLGLFPPLPTRVAQRDVRRQKIVDRALSDLDRWKTQSLAS
ncbi:MAG TPA: methylenetetrahydrofolate--tRNA-(uracil(54)-C(5))-methyltransferase (FADH(2)-oxidizing) TrmFO [Nitrospiria bacterium]|nr:methylenetetrahydrofolate--tRNA-(uracil(54)-C(5))-methyltransferase (FADH(2)-oxidizing) TrmFO [Nitrospiria bacterium]